MFSIVSMQDVLVNLKGTEDLFQKFDRPSRTRKKSTNTKTLISSQDFPIKNVWVLPSHIIILTSFSSKEEILAYDQVPRLGLNKHDVVTLLTNEMSGVFDIFRIVAQTKEYLFILLKDGQIITWLFSRPEYKWSKVDTEYSLFKSKESQLVSFTQDGDVLLWCERRSAAQFCICKINIFCDNDSQVMFRGSKAILHNCLPMTMHTLPGENFTFLPMSNKTLGLFLFWSKHNEEITVRMWGSEFNHHQHVATTTDYQTIVRDCMYLWINHSSMLENNNKASFLFHQATHPTSKELIILQNNLNVHTIFMSTSGVQSKLLCTLEHQGEGKENFAKQIVKFQPLQRMLLLTMVDGTVNIFENQGGLFLWKTLTFRACSPQIWIRKGMYPTSGVWNRSGIWNIRSKPIAEQLKELLMKQKLILEEQTSNNTILMKPSDPDFALDVFESEHRKVVPSSKTSRKWRIKQGVSRSEEIPVKALFNILNMWQLKSASAETALSLAIKLKTNRENGEDDPVDDLTEIFYLIEIIDDPVLLLVLFANKKVFPFKVKRKLTSKLKQLLGDDSCTKRMKPAILCLLQQFLFLEGSIRNLFTTNNKKNEEQTVTQDSILAFQSKLGKEVEKNYPGAAFMSPSGSSLAVNTFDVRKEIAILQHLLCSSGSTGSSSHTSLSMMANGCSFENHVLLLLDVGCKEMLEYILFVLIDKTRCSEADVVGDRFCLELWKCFLRERSRIGTRVLSYLWEQEPSRVIDLVNCTQSFTEKNSERLLPISFKMERFMVFLWSILYLPESADKHKERNYETKLLVINKLLQLQLSLNDSSSLYEQQQQPKQQQQKQQQRQQQHPQPQPQQQPQKWNTDYADYTVDFLLDHNLIDEMFVFLRQLPFDALQHRAAFFRFLVYLVEQKKLAVYASLLVPLTPSTFKMAEFWNVFKQHSVTDSDRSSPCLLFVKDGGVGESESVGGVRDFMEKLL